MMRIKWGEIKPEQVIPDFGTEFRDHIARKKNPAVRSASLSAWNLLANELKSMNLSLPKISFTESGKPYFSDFSLFKPNFSLHNSNFSLNSGAISSNFSLYFSISHSKNIAAAIISDSPCGIDVEIIRSELSERLYARCMHPAEIESGLDFFEAWTRKEAITKMLGCGLPGHPCEINSLDYPRIHSERIFDSAGNAYILSALQE